MTRCAPHTVEVRWTSAPPTPAQLTAWHQLWQRLLSASVPETPQPQDLLDPRAVSATTAMSSGRHIMSEDRHEYTLRTPQSR
jgi:hypothetical protein